MPLKPGSHLILAMLGAGVRTGYAIKRAVDRSTRFFWAASFAQVYPELASLEQDGYVVSADEPHGARPRKTYRLTGKGRRALDDWLNDERIPRLEFRDEGLLRLFFADGMTPRAQLALVQRLRAHAEENARHFQDEILPLAESARGRFVAVVAREGADYFAWRTAWFKALEEQLEREIETGGA